MTLNEEVRTACVRVDHPHGVYKKEKEGKGKSRLDVVAGCQLGPVDPATLSARPPLLQRRRSAQSAIFIFYPRLQLSKYSSQESIKLCFQPPAQK